MLGTSYERRSREAYAKALQEGTERWSFCEWSSKAHLASPDDAPAGHAMGGKNQKGHSPHLARPAMPATMLGTPRYTISKGRCGNTATRNLALRLRQSAPLGASRQSDCAPAGHRSERKNQKGRWPLLTGQPMLRAGLLTIAMTTWWCPAIHLRPAALKIFFSELPDCSSACQQIFP